MRTSAPLPSNSFSHRCIVLTDTSICSAKKPWSATTAPHDGSICSAKNIYSGNAGAVSFALSISRIRRHPAGVVCVKLGFFRALSRSFTSCSSSRFRSFCLIIRWLSVVTVFILPLSCRFHLPLLSYHTTFFCLDSSFFCRMLCHDTTCRVSYHHDMQGVVSRFCNLLILLTSVIFPI